MHRKSLSFLRKTPNKQSFKTCYRVIFLNQFYPCAAVTLTVSLQVWRQHCSPSPLKNWVLSEAKTFESWSLAVPRSKSLAVLSLCHNSTSRGNLKKISYFRVRHQNKRGTIDIHLGKRPHVVPTSVMVTAANKSITVSHTWRSSPSLTHLRSDYHSLLQLTERTILQWK